ncbi:MAG TPA: hypothetical protein VJL33_03670 [Candidatus Bathyarchaeia archaeon]|nr:hypothetical protein [Candidatus Bathyarchaeia archaeon]
MKQFVLTPSAGKRLIAKALARHPTILNALKSGTVVIVAGTTNGYVAEEILKTLGVSEGFSRKRFFRGIILPPGQAVTSEGRLVDESKFPGDVVITKNVWQKGKTILDVIDDLQEGDVIVKGANALDMQKKQAAVLIGHPKAGTIMVALQAVLGRRVSLIVPVGLEKRVNGDLNALAEKVNMPGADGYRLFPVPGQVFTELAAVMLLTGASAEMVAAGGVCGAEGSYLIAVSGTKEQEKAAEELLALVASEPAFTL